MRSVNHANFYDIQKIDFGLLNLLFILLLAFACTQPAHAQGDPNLIYSDGVTPITIQVTADANYEDTEVSGVGNNFSSLGFMLYPLGTTPVPAYGPFYKMPSPLPSAGPGYPVEFGTYSTPPTVGTRGSPGFGYVDTGMVANMGFKVVPQGFYYVLNPGVIIQASPSFPGNGGLGPGAIKSRWIYVDDITVVNPIIPPAQNDPTPPTVYVVTTTGVATKGVGDKLVYTFQRVTPSNDYSKPLTVYYSVGGTAPGSDFSLGQSSPITFAAGSNTAKLKATPIANGVYDSGVTVDVTVQPDQANPTTYTNGTSPASGTILSPDRAPTCYFTTPGISQVDATDWNLSVYVNQSVNITAHTHDDDGNLAAIWIDASNDNPPDVNQFSSTYASGYDYDNGGTASWPTPGTYYLSARSLDSSGVYSATAHLSVTVIDRPPTIQWTTGGISQYGTDPHYQTVAIVPGQTIAISSVATDPDSNLAAIYVDANVDTPPTAGNAWNYTGVSGGAGTTTQNFTGGAPGDQWFSVRSMDSAGAYSQTYYLRVHVDYPPQVAWEGIGNYGQNCAVTLYVGQSLNIQALYYDPDSSGDAELLYTWASSSASGSFTGTDGPRGANVPVFRRYWNSSSNPAFTPTVPGSYVFYAAVSDGMVQPPTISLTVTVPNRPPTIAWAVPGAYQVNANTWELDLPGASAPATIAASGADPDGRMGAVLINRGTGDPTQNQGTPFAQVPGGYASGAMTGDEMRPPLMTALDSAAWEQSNQDNYSWFSAGSYDQDGGVSAPIHLVVRVFNQPPSNAVWTRPANSVPVSAMDSQVTVYANSAAFNLTTSSSDPEQKMWVALINNIYNTPQAGNPTGNEVGVGFSTDGVSATANYKPGAETFDVVGDHWFSAIGIDDGMFYSGGAAQTASHLDIRVLNRLPSASFVTTPSGVNVNQSVTIQGLGTDPDKAMKRVQVQVVSAPVNAGLSAGQVIADTSVPAAQQVYPSNVPTWETDGTVTPSYSGTYTLRTLVWDRHGGTAQTDMSFTVTNRPPVFAWTTANLHVLAGDTVQLPYSVTDPDGNLGIATASGPSGYTMQAGYPNAGAGTGSFAFSSTTPGTYAITGAAFDREGLESVATPTINVVVEPIDTAPVATFTSPAPGGVDSTVTHFVDDIVTVGAQATDVDGNLSTLQIALGSAAWAQSPASGNVSALAASGSFTVPVLGAETSHTYVFGATATDSGTIPGGQVPQAPKSSSTASLKIVVPNRAPTIQWTVPAGGVGLTPGSPYVGYLLQPLKITAHGIDRDGNLAAESIIQINGTNPVLNDASSPDGRTGDVSYKFTPTVPGTYIFAAQAYDKAGATSGQVGLYIQVQDYPSDSTGTIGALIVSPATTISQVFAPGSLPIVVKGGVAALGRSKGRLGVVAASTGVGATQIIPVPNYLNGTQIPPLAPPILDLRTVTVAPTVDHDDPSIGKN